VKAHNNSENLDSKLASAGQQAIQQIVHQLPEDTLSMAWRSSLNERLLADAATAKRRLRFTWFAMPTAGIAVAAALAVGVFLHAPSGSNEAVTGSHTTLASSGSVERGLLDAYRQESESREIVGSGPDPAVDSSHPSLVDLASDSSEVDPDSL
jgi:hypothetical protein